MGREHGYLRYTDYSISYQAFVEDVALYEQAAQAAGFSFQILAKEGEANGLTTVSPGFTLFKVGTSRPEDCTRFWDAVKFLRAQKQGQSQTP